MIETILEDATEVCLDISSSNNNTNNDNEVPATKQQDVIMSPLQQDDMNEWMKKKEGEGEDDDIDGRPKDIPALGPSTLEEVPLGPKGSRLKIDFDEEKAKGGYQDLKNAGKFWRAACLLGTRKDLFD